MWCALIVFIYLYPLTSPTYPPSIQPAPTTDVARLLGIDLRNIQLIFGAIAWLEPDYDFTMVAKE